MQARRTGTMTAIFGAVAVAAASLIGGQELGTVGVLLVGTGVGALTAILLRLTSGLANENTQFQRPNDGFFSATHSALLVVTMFVAVGLASGAFMVLTIFSFSIDTVVPLAQMWPVFFASALAVALSLLILGGVNVALGVGGAGVLQHIALRRALERSGVVPKQFVKFLNSARVAGALYREGGGYTFIVRSRLLRDLLAEHFETV